MPLEPMQQTITLPANCLAALIGPAGCGKSTFAERNFRRSEIVSSDALREMVIDDMTSQAANTEVFDILRRLVQARLKHERLVVVDATNLRSDDRLDLLAQANQVPRIALLYDTTLEECKARNAQRSRWVPEYVIDRHWERYVEITPEKLHAEGFDVVFGITGDEIVSVGGVETHVAAGWDIIGDVHGCYEELWELLLALGYKMIIRGDGTMVVEHPESRKVAFVGDFVDRGPSPVEVLRLVRAIVASGCGVAVSGNHDNKLWRALQGRPVKIGKALEETLFQLLREDVDLQDQITFLGGLPYYVRLTTPRSPYGVILSHGGVPATQLGRLGKTVKDHCLYGEVAGHAGGFPVRGTKWCASYDSGRDIAVYGHTPVDEPTVIGRTLNIDTGCCFGGALTALRYPEWQYEAVQAKRTYAERGVRE